MAGRGLTAPPGAIPRDASCGPGTAGRPASPGGNRANRLWTTAGVWTTPPRRRRCLAAFPAVTAARPLAAALPPGVGSGGGGPSGPRPRLAPAVSIAWRSPSVVQLELGPRRIVIENVRPADLAALLPGEARRRSGAPTRAAAELVAFLDREGFLQRPAVDIGAPRAPGRLLPDIVALEARVGGQADDRVRRRAQAGVVVQGATRLAGTLAATLAGAGVGRVGVSAPGEVTIDQACPGGFAPADEGRPTADAATDLLKRSAPESQICLFSSRHRPDLVVLTEPGPVPDGARAGLHLDRQPHLAASTTGSRLVVGPLVLPGRTSCLRCADLHRQDRDPAWAALAAQLSAGAPKRAGSEVALCVAGAGLTAAAALAFLDGDTGPAENGTLEWQLPDWRLRRRSWPAHRDCDCGSFGRRPRGRPDGRMVP
jgi:hypothetical protein